VTGKQEVILADSDSRDYFRTVDNTFAILLAVCPSFDTCHILLSL
jgi:hypothetical protein